MRNLFRLKAEKCLYYLTGKLTRKYFTAVAGVLLATGLTGHAYGAESSEELLDLLISKGIITQDEATKIKSETELAHTNQNNFMPSSKWKISEGIKSVELFGDIRMRYEDRTARDPSNGSIELQRLRYSLRFGLRGELFDGFDYGFRLETASNPRSPWVTFGTTSSSSPPYQGSFGKSTAGLNVGQAYLGWHRLEWFDVMVGKMPNPLYTTPMVWDTDINPEGLAEKFNYTVGLVDFFANFGQFIYQDTNPVRTPNAYVGIGGFPSTSSDLAFMLAWQAGFDAHITEKFDVKVAGGLYNYTGRGANTTIGNSHFPGFTDTFVGQGSANNITGAPYSGYSGYSTGNFDGFTSDQTGINDLLVIEIPWEMNYKMKWFNLRLFGDYAQNLDGKQRAMDAFAAQSAATALDNTQVTAPISSPQTGDDKAYQIGIGIGSTNQIFGPMQGLVYGSAARKHAWELRTYWQHVEQYALDVNLMDSDFFEGRGNLEGFYAAFAYALTDNMVGTFRYGYAHRINKNLGTGGSNQDIPQINPVDQYNILQFDLSMRF